MGAVVCGARKTPSLMGRSVDYLTYAVHVAYFALDLDGDQLAYEEMVEMLEDLLQEEMPSLEPVQRKWDGETKIVAQNRFARVGLAEYCGLWSLSIGERPDTEVPQLAGHWAACMGPKVDRIAGVLGERLVRLGTMSNGCGVYKRA